MIGSMTMYPTEPNLTNSINPSLHPYPSNTVFRMAVFGPSPFLSYINDISQIFTNNFITILFADNSTLYITGENPTDMLHTANADLQIFHE